MGSSITTRADCEPLGAGSAGTEVWWDLGSMYETSLILDMNIPPLSSNEILLSPRSDKQPWPIAVAVSAAEVPSPAERGVPSLGGHLQTQIQEGTRDPHSAATHGARVLCIEKSYNICFSTSSLGYFSGLLLSCKHNVQLGCLTHNARDRAVQHQGIMLKDVENKSHVLLLCCCWRSCLYSNKQ